MSNTSVIRTEIGLSWGPISLLDWRPDRDPAQPTVLLLHGGGVDDASLSWGGVGPLLARAGYRVIAPDHPGYGQSPSAPWKATQRRLVAYVGELVDALGLTQHAIGGLSLGGGMAIGYALGRPENLTGAMLLSSYGLMPRLSGGRLS